MINDKEYVEQSVTRSLYFLRTIREYCANINLSFYVSDLVYSERANQIQQECERLGRIIVANAGGNVSPDAFTSGIFLTPYTLPLEELTQKLFGIEIATDITKAEQDLEPGTISTITPEVVAQITNVDKEIRQILEKFIALVEEILVKQRSNLLFSTSYPTLFAFMIQQAKLYDTELERLLAREALDPIYVVNHQFLYNTSMYNIATFLRGYIDPSHTEQIEKSDQFIRDFSNLVMQYQKAPADPYLQNTLMEYTSDLLSRFNAFVETLLQGVLSAEIYFIVEPAFLDNMYTDIHYFQYILKQAREQEANPY
ncbi:MAG: DUF2935 domain-containing protein [Bacilli bacterium]|nr:DUF2935 domain-containing protein [Bacilli bacterium]